MSLLPVRPQPAPGEHLHSLAERTIRLNTAQPAAMRLRAQIRREAPSAAFYSALSAAIGTACPVLRDMTLEIYPNALVGHRNRRNATARTWRLPGVRWSCPACTARTGVFLRDWQLAVHPLCTGCPRLLQIHPQDGTYDAGLVPDDDALGVQERIAYHLQVQRSSTTVLPHFRAVYRLTTLLAITADDDWPPLAGWEADVTRVAGERYRDWAKRPPRDPAQAVLVLEAWRGIESPSRGGRLITEGWQRLREHPNPAVRALEDAWHTVLPRPPAPSMRLPGAPVERASWEEVERLATDLETLTRSSGLGPQHVPAWLTLDAERFAPPPAQWALRAELAVVTRALLASPGRANASAFRAKTELGLPRVHLPVSRWVQEERGITPGHAELVRNFARRLVTEDLVDYAERRRHLVWGADSRRQIRAVMDLYAIPGTLTATWGWMWIFFTRGPRSTRRATDAACVLDESLDPEQRYLLADAAHEILAEVIDPTGLTASGALGAPDRERDSA